MIFFVGHGVDGRRGLPDQMKKSNMLLMMFVRMIQTSEEIQYVGSSNKISIIQMIKTIVIGKDSAEPIPQMSLPTINRAGKHIFSKNLWRLRKVEDSFICIDMFHS